MTEYEITLLITKDTYLLNKIYNNLQKSLTKEKDILNNLYIKNNKIVFKQTKTAPHLPEIIHINAKNHMKSMMQKYVYTHPVKILEAIAAIGKIEKDSMYYRHYYNPYTKESLLKTTHRFHKQWEIPLCDKQKRNQIIKYWKIKFK